MDASPAIVLINPIGLKCAQKIQASLTGAQLHILAEKCSPTKGIASMEFSDVGKHLRTLFAAGTPIIGVCASGILIRLLAPVLGQKAEEPPVLAVSEDGASVVPLLGGHRGANRLARTIAGLTGGHAAITTAGETALGVALDEPPPGWELANPQHAKGFMAKLLAGQAVRLEGEADWLAESAIAFSSNADLSIIVGSAPCLATPQTLVYHRKTHVVGLGSARGCSFDELKKLVDDTLKEAEIAVGAVAAFTSLDLKADEPAMNQLAAHYGKPFRVFSKEELLAQAGRLQNPSDVVRNEVGVPGVCEGAALSAVGTEGRLVVAKRKSANATVAIAEAPETLDPNSFGRARGRLLVVGIGPGCEEWRTPEVSRFLQEAEEVVGYSLYLDLVASLITSKTRHAFPLGAEEDRVRFALERAATGKTVALVCSGDSGIYAMGALVYELLDRKEKNGGVSDAARRVEVTSSPGVSAMVALSNRCGAPLGHDFCAISLSDLLTPWETIVQRIEGAALADFTIGFYNPVSKRRRTQLAYAKDVLLKHRPADTPVVLGANIGRTEEKIITTTLGALEVDDVDMLTTVLVGSSQTRRGGDGVSRDFVYTPRGYSKKIDAGKLPNSEDAA
ncbi:precorrin-3B C(17)-methyltransferase [Pseudovibrio sp. SPO723]|uniref:precorrin-3B C(17)-methyltransferase n=1 Tax=Nesiotobacter zosterae TaxID=392721 RepID=UPI0029C43AB2|nr:precorrin-3B C(17)-methyltransferase [Pseudovibrio sp. SPO723]MDX5592229.1 precorrin-3B C(17)-methyltransferase [Pseudovibrio sp. SPO723]